MDLIVTLRRRAMGAHLAVTLSGCDEGMGEDGRGGGGGQHPAAAGGGEGEASR